MTRIIMATNNAHKLDEARHILGEEYSVLGLAEPAINLIIFTFKALDKPSICLGINREILVCH